MIATLCCLGLLAGVLAGGVTAPAVFEPAPTQPEKQPHIRASLISEDAELRPGQTSWIGLDLAIEKGWHTYWNGRNDTGTPPAVKWTTPAGYKVGEFRWPAPKRYLQHGDTLDHVYEGHVLLIAPIEVPATAKVGDTVEITAACTFVVCQDMCVMEKASPTLKLKVGEGKTRGDAGARFDETRKLIPVPLKDAKGVTAKVEGGKLVVEAKGASRVMFYPTEDSVGTPDLLKEGEARGEKLTLTLEPSEGAKRIRGVVEARGGGLKEPVYVDVHLEVPRS